MEVLTTSGNLVEIDETLYTENDGRRTRGFNIYAYADGYILGRWSRWEGETTRYIEIDADEAMRLLGSEAADPEQALDAAREIKEREACTSTR